MYLKRFIQLFVVFLISLAVFALILEMNFGNYWLRFVLGLIIAYVFLTLPLVLLTIFKTNKKAKGKSHLMKILYKKFVIKSIETGAGVKDIISL